MQGAREFWFELGVAWQIFINCWERFAFLSASLPISQFSIWKKDMDFALHCLTFNAGEETEGLYTQFFLWLVFTSGIQHCCNQLGVLFLAPSLIGNTLWLIKWWMPRSIIYIRMVIRMVTVLFARFEKITKEHQDDNLLGITWVLNAHTHTNRLCFVLLLRVCNFKGYTSITGLSTLNQNHNTFIC